MRPLIFSALVAVALFSVPLSADAVRLYADVPDTAYGPGDTFIATVRIDNEDECINVGRVVLTYPKEVLKAVDFSRGGSVFTLWIEDALLNHEQGEVVFEGGIPGGYCGRIQGDPSLSNVLGKVIFTVLDGSPGQASLDFSSRSEFYINDGIGTLAPLSSQLSAVSLIPESKGAENAWVREVEADDTPPEAFVVRVESTVGVFNGDYYAVFGTVDKQSGLSHFEIFERGAWKRIESPYRLRDQTLEGGVSVRAFDKAGNERLGSFDASVVPERVAADAERLIFIIFMVLLVFGGVVAILVDRARARRTKTQ